MIIIPSNVGASVLPVTSGQVLNLDAGLSTSYSGSGTTWYDLSGSGNNFTLSSSSFTTLNSVPVMKFDGTVQSATIASGNAFSPGSDVTVQAFTTINTNADYHTLLRSVSSYHQILTWSDGNIGVYNGGWYTSGINI